MVKGLWIKFVIYFVNMHESFSLSSSVVNDRQRAILEEFAKDEFAYENDTSMERNWLELLHRHLFVKLIGYVFFCAWSWLKDVILIN